MKKLDRLALAAQVIFRYVRIRLLLMRRSPLPMVVDRLAPRDSHRDGAFSPPQLRRAVDRILRLPGRPLRCLPRALVLYSLLAERGYEPRLAIGLPESSSDVTAHAWVEVDGIDVGPSPGRNGHTALTTYPLLDPSEDERDTVE